jgi:uroporphyrinogen decarboxylase
MFIERMKDYVGAICIGGDLGGQQSPMVKPDVFADIIAPYLKTFCGFIHANSDYKIFLHSCGSIEPLLPVLIECGVDIINPVQISASNMDPMSLKRKYGKDIVFWGGGVDTQNVLSFKEPCDVAENVGHLTGIFKPGGGYVFCPVHNIMGDVKPENVIAAYDAAYENSFY